MQILSLILYGVLYSFHSLPTQGSGIEELVVAATIGKIPLRVLVSLFLILLLTKTGSNDLSGVQLSCKIFLIWVKIYNGSI